MRSAFKNKFVRVIVLYHYFAFRVMGLMPFGYNSSAQLFESSLLALIYSIICTLLLALVHPMYTDFYVTIVDQTDGVGSNGQITDNFYKVLNLLIVTFYLLNIYQHRAVMKALNKALQLFRNASAQLPSDDVKISDWVTFNLLQSVFIHFVYLVIFLNFRYTLSEVTAANLLIGILALIPYGYWNLFLNLYTNVLTVLLLIYRIVNRAVEDTSFIDQLQMAFSVHRHTNEVCMSTMSSMAHFMAAILGQLFCCTVYEVYYQYSHILQSILFNQPVAPQIVAGGFSILPLFCCILMMHVTMCVKCVAESKKLVTQVNDKDPEISSNFLVYMGHKSCRITVYDMFEVNFELLFLFYATIFSYVIILVQFDVAN